MRIVAVVMCVAGICSAVPGVAVGQVPDSAVELKDAPPAWFTAELKERIDAAGNEGVPMSELAAAPSYCPGIQQQPGISAGTCIFSPASCSANFVFYTGTGAFPTVSAGTQHFIGTAGHCVEYVGQPVYMQVDTPGIGAAVARVGTVATLVANGIGDDFAAIRINSGFRVNPAFPVGGPAGIYTGCLSLTVDYWGHGYQGAGGPGKPLSGYAAHWYDDSYGFTGASVKGDSGSGVVGRNDQVAGILTHLIVHKAFPTSDVAGTRMTKILRFLGTAFKLVNADGTLVRQTTTVPAVCDGRLPGFAT